uniref:Copia protein n=1 Tax=Lygus hesperus TaxID=30085 RepID=A0A0A9WME1_LYGHE
MVLPSVSPTSKTPRERRRQEVSPDSEERSVDHLEDNDKVFEEAEEDTAEEVTEDQDEVEVSPIKSIIKRIVRPPVWMKDYISYFCDENDLESYNENDDEWHDAIKGEISAHIHNGTWEMVARSVARGFAQPLNIDFH